MTRDELGTIDANATYRQRQRFAIVMDRLNSGQPITAEWLIEQRLSEEQREYDMRRAHVEQP